MKVAIIGSRKFNNVELLNFHLNKLNLEYNFSQVISGGAVGADVYGETWAKNNNIPTKIFKPNWSLYGKSAGVIRNKDIINNSEIVVAFWDGISKGTKSSIDIARKQNKKVIIINE